MRYTLYKILSDAPTELYLHFVTQGIVPTDCQWQAMTKNPYDTSWRKYVPEEAKDDWDLLSDETKFYLFVSAVYAQDGTELVDQRTDW